MKWPGTVTGGSNEPAPSMQLHHPSANGHMPSDMDQCAQIMASGDAMRLQAGQTNQISVNRTQDDAMVGYVFQRPTEPDYNAQATTFQSKQAPRAWALADDAIIDNQSQPQQLGLQTMNNVHLPYELHPMQLKPTVDFRTLIAKESVVVNCCQKRNDKRWRKKGKGEAATLRSFQK
ncbi:hypothetical protein G9C98_003776 [Cotesia typhae]|uniref:Uncharacterized protein n=1 Tax=Cotesia typhae TaxID=2053667 RepID=A0A8J5V755_9HYME|nr:hypothetical protein G9C98_003776 [Cotesia typhae]